MQAWIDLLNWTNIQLKETAKNSTTYENDTEGAHADGRYGGKVAAYTEVIKHCAEQIAKEN